jgi:glycine oxidase
VNCLYPHIYGRLPKIFMMSTRISIIGCGIIGAMLAYELSLTQKYQIDVFDSQPPAGGATGAALGVMMGIISQKVKGRAWQLRDESIQRYHVLIPELERLTGQKIPYNSQGLVKLLLPEDDLGKWSQLVVTRSQQQWQLALWDAAQLAARLPQIDVRETTVAAYSPQDLQVEPIALTNALVAAAQSQGVNFHFDRSIASIDAHNPDSCELLTPDLPNIATDWAIVTAGLGATSLLSPHAPIVINPVLGQAMRVRLPQPLGNPHFQPVIIDRDVNIVPCGGNEYWIGATVEFPIENLVVAQAEYLDRMHQIAIATCPDLAKGEIIQTWQGLRPRPHNRPAPILDRVGDNNRIIVATGHYRNGILLAPATARIVGEMLVNSG